MLYSSIFFIALEEPIDIDIMRERGREWGWRGLNISSSCLLELPTFTAMLLVIHVAINIEVKIGLNRQIYVYAKSDIRSNGQSLRLFNFHLLFTYPYKPKTLRPVSVHLNPNCYIFVFKFPSNQISKN